MPTTITLKGVPDKVYAQLKSSAEVHHRSLSSEAIACLESVLLPRKMSASDHAARAREMRQALTARGRVFKHQGIDKLKREGSA